LRGRKSAPVACFLADTVHDAGMQATVG
jgi:hypothetical protein